MGYWTETQTLVRPDLLVPATNKKHSSSALEQKPSGHYRSISFLLQVALDLPTIAAAFLVGMLVYRWADLGHHASTSAPYVLKGALMYFLAFTALMEAHGGYSQSYSLLRVRETERILSVSVRAILVIFIVGFFAKVDMPRLPVAISWAVASIALIVQKQWTYTQLSNWSNRQKKSHRVLIYGTGSVARRLFTALLGKQAVRVEPAFFDPSATAGAASKQRVIYSNDYRHERSAQVVSGTLNADLLRDLGITEIFFATGSASSKETDRVTALAHELGIRVSFVGHDTPHSGELVPQMKEVDGILVTSYGEKPSDRGLYLVCKRLFDIAIAAGIFVALLPLWTAIAFAIHGSSKGPIFFRQRRIGKNGVPFYMYKFRSMYVNAPAYMASPSDPNDPRITPIGRILRKTSFDELPQLINVLKGDMSLVGPRPEMPQYVERYTQAQMRRLDVTPGITGLWQLSADRKYAIHESIEYDLYYIQHKSFSMDIALLMHTLVFAMRGI